VATYADFLTRVHPDDRSLVERTIRRAFDDGQPFEFEHRIVRPEGEVRVHHARGEVVNDAHGRPRMMVGTGQDITERKQLEEERAALLAAEREVTRRLADLAVLKADFTAMIAHELGSPLAAVRWSAELLASEAMTDNQASALATIRSETDALVALIADVHTAAAGERHDFATVLRPASVDAILADATAFARTLPGDHPIICNRLAQVEVLADAQRIGQVFRNLLSNAAKYSPPSSPIEIRGTRDGGHVRFEVVDRGVGVAPDEVTCIFEKFGRARDVTGERVPGLGLGLYLSRRIVRAHGGELTVDSRPGTGSTFGFALEVLP
jgi:signal transduction histidine kinase